MLKRSFDIIAALLGLLVLSPVLAVAAVLVWWSSPGPILFRQQRMGRGFRPFTILKFRTMRYEPDRSGALITASGDRRVTWIGELLRKTKIDELPQLYNVLRGDMSFVGPRPEVSRYVEMFRREFAEILSVRPGITDPASLRFRNESEMLAAAADPEQEYIGRILPQKLELARNYLRSRSFLGDLSILCRTVLRIAGG